MNHKDIGTLYLLFGVVSVVVGVYVNKVGPGTMLGDVHNAAHALVMISL